MFTSDTATNVFIWLVAILAIIFITRLLFSIPTIVRNLELQTKILKRMAEKEGISQQEFETKKKSLYDKMNESF